MNILSLFDGISCGQLALNRAGIKYDSYFASEIDKNAIKVTQRNFPNTIQLGTVEGLDNWNLPEIDILLGGSPCTGFSQAGKGLAFDDPQSRLYSYYLKAFKKYKPKYFLLENVRMKQEYQDKISDDLGVHPIEINSNLVSAQNRKRLYWTNIPNITQPLDKGLSLVDILESAALESKEMYNIISQDVLDYRGFVSKISQRRIIKNFRGSDMKANCMTSSNTNNPAGNGCTNIIFQKTDGTYDWRKTTVKECERLQTLPDGYTSVLSEGPAKHAIGNGWTVNVITHILKNIK